ncbi:MAG: Smr/MutS family protein [Pseudolabrys sp.]
MAPRDGKRRVLSYDERVLWTMVTKSVAPMRDPLPDVEEPATSAADEKPAVKRARAPAPAAAPPPPPKPSAPPLQTLDRRTRQRVARGREQIDARFDLHGLTQSEAHDALSRFLHSASARGARLVLIITGKGARDGGERGVLRRQVPQWLALPDLRSLVIGFEDAHVAHGGEGALYVRLRRRRDGGN